jgi:hypothetical protein
LANCTIGCASELTAKKTSRTDEPVAEIVQTPTVAEIVPDSPPPKIAFIFNHFQPGVISL